MRGERKIFGVRSSLILSLGAKFSILLIGVAIMGLLSTRSELTVCGSSSPGNVSIYSAPLGDVEAYTDYRDLYLRCLVNPFLAGKSAYNLPIVYNYPPLFLYLVSGFALLNYVWTAAIPLVLFDALTVVPLYLIARDYLFKGNAKLAFAVALIWIFNPINLFYNDLMWLNPAPTTFFVMLSIYLLLKKEWTFSSISLAIATGLKQTAVLLFPIFFIWMLRTTGVARRKILAYSVLYVAALVLISTPYVFQNPQSYFWSLQLPIFGTPPGGSSINPTTFEYDLSQPTRITTFLGLIKFVNLQSFTVATYNYLNYVFGFFYVLVLLEFGIGLRNLRSALTLFSRRSPGVSKPVQISSIQKLPSQPETLKKPRVLSFLERPPTANELLIYCLSALLLFLALFGRGDYKYYFAGVTPLAIPLFQSKKRAIIFAAFSAALVLLPREVTPWMAVLLLTAVPQLIGSYEEAVVPSIQNVD
jgi:hypothetical protein